MKKGVYEAVATLIGTIMGAGILGLPYVISQVGFIPGFVLIITIGIAVLFMNLFLGEIVLRTKKTHQMAGYAEKYLGKNAKKIATLSLMVGVYGALTAYLIGIGKSLSEFFSIPSITLSIIAFIILSFIVHRGIKALGDSEIVFGSIMFLIILTIAFIAIFSSKFSPQILAFTNLEKIFLPYGVILFAFLGATAIPEMKEEILRNKIRLERAIIIGSIIPIALYAFFAFAVVGTTGLQTTEISTIGLGNLLGYKMIILANLFAIFAMVTSFIALAYALKQMYMYDYKIKEDISWGLTVLPPLIIVLLNLTNFIQIIGISGAFAGGIDGIIITLVLWKAKKNSERQPEYSLRFTKLIGAILLIIFTLGIIYQISALI